MKITILFFVAGALFLVACNNSSLEQCAIQLLEKKYGKLPDMNISYLKENRVRVEGVAYECAECVPEYECAECVPESENFQGINSSGLYIDVVIESSGNQCEVVENHSFIDDCIVPVCPTPVNPN